jgi:hypothetical protein
MALLDFDSLVICNDDHNLESLKLTMDHFRELGIRNFIITMPVDLVNDPWASIKNNYKSFKDSITTIKPRGCTVSVVHNTYIVPGAAFNPILHKLTFAKTNRLFIQIPLFLDDSWFSPEINYFLYKQKLLPIFTRFERTLISSNKEFSTKLYKIQKGAYCVDINYMTSIDGIPHIKEGMRAGAIILPAISNNYNAYIAEEKRFAMMSDRMGRILYLKFCKYMNTCCKSIFGLL